jgi:hypothetical protein
MAEVTDPCDLDRFVSAQEPVFDTGLRELWSRRKRSHWMWFVFPQLRALGRSSMTDYYGISFLAEARAYLANRCLAADFVECLKCWGHNSISAISSTVLVRGGIAPCDFRLAGRHEVPVMRNAVRARGKGGRQPVSAGARLLV